MSYDLGTAHGKIVLDYDGEHSVRQAERDMDKLERKSKDSDKSLGKLGKTLSVLGSGVKFGAIAVAFTQAAASAGAMAIQIAGMVPQLVSIASLSAALPGFYAGLAVSIGVLKAAFAGVGDAVKEAFSTESPEKFEKALEKLSPAAKAFAIALREVAPEFKAIQQGIQEAFFSNNLQEFLPNIVSGLKSLQGNLNGLAADFGALGREMLSSTAGSDRFWEFLDSAITNVRNNLNALKPAIKPIVDGFLAVGNVGLPILDKMGAAVGNAGVRFGEWMQQIASSGQLQEWINLAVATLKTLGGIIKNVASILTSVFGAANETGGSLLATIKDLTGQFAAFLKTPEGAEAMRALFTGIMEVARQLGPIITTLAGTIASALGPALKTIGETFGPVLLDVIKALAPAFGPLVQAAADLLAALAPLLPPIAQLIALLAGVLTNAVQGLVAEFAPLIKIWGSTMVTALEAFTPLIAEMAKGLPLAAEAGAQLAAAFAPLMPVIVELAQVIAESLLEVMPELLAEAEKLMPSLVELATIFADQLAESLKQIIPYIPMMVKAFTALLPLLIQAATFGLKLILWANGLKDSLVNLINKITEFGSGLAEKFMNAVQGAYDAIVEAGQSILDWFDQLPDKIGEFLKDLPGNLKDLFVNALEGAATAVGFGAGLIVGAVTKLPGKIINAISTLGQRLLSWAQAAWNLAKQKFQEGIDKAVAVARALPGKITNAINTLPSKLATMARNAWKALQDRFNSGVNTARNKAAELPNKIKSALSNIGNILYSSGTNIINGLIRGINSGVQRVLNLIRGLGNRIKDAFNNAMDIFSPSRVMFKSGVYIDEGLINGIRSKMAAVAKTASQLAQSVIAPTVSLPASASGAIMTAAAPVAAQRIGDVATGRAELGPYILEMDGQAIARIAIDAVTGQPKLMATTVAEGMRLKTFTGSGRLVSATR